MEQTLTDDIKFNCNISDAQYWGYFSICGLLMRYRDLFRSEKGLKAWAEINRDEIGAWIADKESQWPDLEGSAFRDLRIGGKTYDPFDVAGINLAIRERGLVYGAGYGMYMKPTFFLAELRSTREVSGMTVFTSGTEFVRDLFTAPGMLQEQTIFLRLEPLTMLLMYKFSELNARRIAPLEDAFTQYGFQHRQLIDDIFEERLRTMAERYAEVLLRHEIAESREETPEWKDILSRAGDRKTEQYLRAVKDLLADTSDHGPYQWTCDNRDRGALSLSVALMEGFRRALFPEMREAYAEFSHEGDWSLIERARRDGYARFRSLRDRVVALHRENGGRDDFNGKIKEMLSASGL